MKQYDEGIKDGARLMEKVQALPDSMAKQILVDILKQHAPVAPCSSFNSRYGFAECDSVECFEDGGDNGAILSSWPCAAVQPILSAFDE